MKKVLLVLGGLGAVALAFGLWFFEPWRLWTSSEIDEGLPVTGSVVTAPAEPGSAAEPGVTPTAPAPTGPTVLSQGRFVDAEHDTSGTARILELADGTRYLRLEGLDTSDGPDLHVWLSDAKPGGSWGKYDDGDYVRLGELKATRGNQNYRIPDGADLGAMRSAVIWCDRFNVAFGTAPVAVAG